VAPAAPARVSPPPSEHRERSRRSASKGQALSRLAAYLDTLAAWSPRVNLTGAQRRPSACGCWWGTCSAAGTLPAPGRLIDVGSATALRAWCWRLLRDDLEVTLLEAAHTALGLSCARRRAPQGARVCACCGCATTPILAARGHGNARALSLPLAELLPLLEPQGTPWWSSGASRRTRPGSSGRAVGRGLPGELTVFRRPR
jgi:hypothetical protein